MDIGCRMALSVFDISEKEFLWARSKIQTRINSMDKIWLGSTWQHQLKAQHDVLDRNEFSMTAFVKNLQDKASSQLGTSGGGNHFVEWGIIEFMQDDIKLNIKKGNYLALLTHSGSRGFGATVAGYYTKLAKELCRLPKEAANLAYLDMNSAEGIEYWMAMNLAGDYASVCA